MVIFNVCKPAAFQGRTSNTWVSWKGFFRGARSLCRGFCVVEKSSAGRVNASAFSSHRKSHISKWKAFRNKAAIMFLWKEVCPLTSDISYRRAREGKEREQIWKRRIDNLFLTPFSTPQPFLPNMEPLSRHSLSPFEAVSTFTHYLSSHPSISKSLSKNQLVLPKHRFPRRTPRG